MHCQSGTWPPLGWFGLGFLSPLFLQRGNRRLWAQVQDLHSGGMVAITGAGGKVSLADSDRATSGTLSIGPSRSSLSSNHLAG